MRNITFFIVAAPLLASANAAARPQYETAAPIAYMVDLASGAVLIDKHSRQKIPPASMTKMMTAYVAFDLIDRPRQIKSRNTIYRSPRDMAGVE